MLKRLTIPFLALAFFLLQTQSALACGGLIAPDDIEDYMTSFIYEG